MLGAAIAFSSRHLQAMLWPATDHPLTNPAETSGTTPPGLHQERAGVTPVFTDSGNACRGGSVASVPPTEAA